MAPPSDAQINRILRLVWKLHELVDRSCADVYRALLATRTMRYLGYQGSGRIETQEQAEAYIRILESWIRKKGNEHQQRDDIGEPRT